MDKILVRTPKPRTYESLAGYVSRVAQENGYSSPGYILGLMGLTLPESLLSLRFAEKLAPILGREKDDLIQMAYCVGRRRWQIFGHAISQASPPRLRIRNPQICVACIEENGFSDVTWDVNEIISCPKHVVYLVSSCIDCRRPLSFFRRSLLTCKCGSEISRSELRPNSAVSELMSYLVSRIKKQAVSIENFSRYPIAHLDNLEINTLLDALRLLGKFRLGWNAEKPDIKSLIEESSWVLSNWPENFFLTIREFTVKHMVSKGGLAARLNPIYRPLLNLSKQNPQTKFLLDAFIEFSLDYWAEGVVDAKLTKGEPNAGRFVSLSELARRWNITRATLRSWVQNGKIQVQKKVLESGQIRYIADSQQLPKELYTSIESGDFGAKDKVLSLVDASRILELPTHVFIPAHLSHHYEVKNIPVQVRGCSVKDLEVFRSKILSLAPLSESQYVASKHIPLSKILKFTHINGKLKAMFFIDYLSGTVKADFRLSDKIGDIIFKRTDIDRFLMSCPLDGISITLRRARLLLDSTTNGVSHLVQEGHLVSAGSFHRVTTPSLRNFLESYVSTSNLGDKLGVNWKVVMDTVRAMGVPYIDLTRKGGRVLFVRISDADRICDDLTKQGNPKARKKPSTAYF